MIRRQFCVLLLGLIGPIWPALAGEPPLIGAVRERNAGRVEDLLGRGANPDSIALNGESALDESLALQYRYDPRIPRALLRKGAHPAKGAHSIQTPLFGAIYFGDAELARFLLSAGARPDQTRNLSRSETDILEQGPTVKQYEAAKPALSLLTHLNPYLRYDAAAFFLALKMGDEERLERWIRNGADPNHFKYRGDTPLTYSAKNGLAGPLKAMLRLGARPDLPDEHGLSPLRHACKLREYEIIESLLSHGADPYAKGSGDWYFGFGLANIDGFDVRIANILLDHGVDPRKGHVGDYSSPLALAATHGGVELVKRYLKFGVRLDPKYITGGEEALSATSYMTAEKRKEVIGVILETVEKVDPRGDTGYYIISTALKNGFDGRVIKWIKAMPANVQDKRGVNLFLWLAVEHNRPIPARAALEAGADPDLKDSYYDHFGMGSFPLCIAIRSRNSAMAELLLSAGANPKLECSDWEGSAEHLAALTGNVSVADALRKRGHKLPSIKLESHKPSLHESLGRGYLGYARALLGNGEDINSRDKHGLAPIHWAVADVSKPHSLEAVELALSMGADPNARWKHGETPLFILLRSSPGNMPERMDDGGKYGKNCPGGLFIRYNPRRFKYEPEPALENTLKIIELLTASGADVNSATEDGQAPVHLAAQGGGEAVMESLLDKGADINAQACFGEKAIHMAAQAKDMGMIRLLRKRGATVPAELTAEAETAALNAEKEYRYKLKRYGAKYKYLDHAERCMTEMRELLKAISEGGANTAKPPAKCGGCS